MLGERAGVFEGTVSHQLLNDTQKHVVVEDRDLDALGPREHLAGLDPRTIEQRKQPVLPGERVDTLLVGPAGNIRPSAAVAVRRAGADPAALPLAKLRHRTRFVLTGIGLGLPARGAEAMHG